MNGEKLFEIMGLLSDKTITQAREESTFYDSTNAIFVPITQSQSIQRSRFLSTQFVGVAAAVLILIAGTVFMFHSLAPEIDTPIPPVTSTTESQSQSTPPQRYDTNTRKTQSTPPFSETSEPTIINSTSEPIATETTAHIIADTTSSVINATSTPLITTTNTATISTTESTALSRTTTSHSTTSPPRTTTTVTVTTTTRISANATPQTTATSTPPTDYILMRGVKYPKNLTVLVLNDLVFTNSEIEPLKHMTNLQSLALNENRISDLAPIAGLTQLIELGIGTNPIKDLSLLSGLVNLKRLYLTGDSSGHDWGGDRSGWIPTNQFNDLTPLGSLTKLEELDLSYNPAIKDFSPLYGLKNLRILDLTGNYLTSQQLNALRAALPNCNIIY
jgi:Leucine-rich repeat (LRR) protein